VQEITAKAFK